MKPTTSNSGKLRGSAEIRVLVDDSTLLRALYEAFYRDAKDTKAKYSLKLEGSALTMSVKGLDVGDLRAFVNSNLRLLKVVLEGLKVVR